jgi:hypothetical protein
MISSILDAKRDTVLLAFRQNQTFNCPAVAKGFQMPDTGLGLFAAARRNSRYPTVNAPRLKSGACEANRYHDWLIS